MINMTREIHTRELPRLGALICQFNSCLWREADLTATKMEDYNMQKIIVTAENIEDVRESVPVVDQMAELEVGCETWGIIYQGGQRGQMTIWPSGRGAVMHGGDSEWGEWDAQSRTLTTDDGTVYDEAGDKIKNDD
jgi:hypothetical protein